MEYTSVFTHPTQGNYLINSQNLEKSAINMLTVKLLKLLI